MKLMGSMVVCRLDRRNAEDSNGFIIIYLLFGGISVVTMGMLELYVTCLAFWCLSMSRVWGVPYLSILRHYMLRNDIVLYKMSRRQFSRRL